MSIVLDVDVVADYVLQVNLVFRPKASNVLGSFNVWRKTGLFGSSDELMKMCPANGCMGVFRDSFHITQQEEERLVQDLGADAADSSKWPMALQNRYANWFTMLVRCPECGRVSVRESLPDSYGFNMTRDKIASRMSEFFDKLGGSCDVYMVKTKEDMVFQKARQALHRGDSHYGKMLESARDRDSVYYGLKDILRDTSTSASKAARFRSLIGA